MNQILVNRFQARMTEDNRQEILALIAEAAPEDSNMAELLTDIAIVKKIVNIAAGYVNSATARLSQEATWEMLLGTTEIAVSLQELIKNPSIVNYTQAVMLITAALLKEDDNGRQNHQ